MSAARQAWVAAHPYLEPMARFQAIVEDAVAAAPPPRIEAPRWESYAKDHAAGVPLLRSASAGLECSAAAADELGRLTERVAEARLPGAVGNACCDLRDAFRRSPEARIRAVEWIVAGAPAENAPACGGLLKFLGWTAASGVLEPILEGSAPWREEERWGRGHCPTCGSLPVLAHLAPGEASRPRFLVCGCCRTRWKFRRIGCPFCGTAVPDRLGILQVEDEVELRIDVCDECRGYVKTYTGDGDEELFLADWPTLHLDVLASERGFQRMGASLYEL